MSLEQRNLLSWWHALVGRRRMAVPRVASPADGAGPAARLLARRAERTSVLLTLAAWCCILVALTWRGSVSARAAGFAGGGERVAGSRGGAATAQQTVLDLSRRESFALLHINADPKDVCIQDVQVKHLPSPYHLSPREGFVWFGHPVDIVLTQPPNVRIRLSLVKRGQGLALRVSPQICFGPGDIVTLTHSRIERTARSLRRRLKDLRQKLSALAREQRCLETWLLSPANKPLHTVKAVRMRLKILEQELEAHKQQLPLIAHRAVALGQIADFACQLHKRTEIHFQTRTGAKRRNGAAGR